MILSNLVVRSIAGIVFSVAVISASLLGPLPLGLLFLFFAGVGLHELYALLKRNEKYSPRWFRGMISGLLIYLLVFFIYTGTISIEWLWILAIVVPVILCMELKKLDEHTLPNVAVTVFGWIYVILPFSFINMLPYQSGTFDYELPVAFFLVLWANDTGAYFTGKFLGRTKLYERVSPNKTWEGLFGGVLFSFLIAYVLSCYFDSLILRDWMALAFIVSVFGNLGDLFESQLKRNYNVKDSGNLIPGHGGVLDRFDGLLIALPVLIGYLNLVHLL